MYARDTDLRSIADQAITITRIFDAPRASVFRAWTEPKRLQRWWGPKDFTAPHCTLDLRVGGTYLYCMRSAQGQDYWSTGVFREIDRPARIVYTDSFADQDGNPVAPSHYGMTGTWPRELVVTATFDEYGKDKTAFTLRHVGIPAGEMRDMAKIGWQESLDKLAASLHRSTRR